MIRFTTNLGSFDLELDAKAAPKTVANFERYVKEGFYNDTLFHRVIDGFMIQGGGFEAGMQHKEGHAPIENEAMNGLKNDKYTIATGPHERPPLRDEPVLHQRFRQRLSQPHGSVRSGLGLRRFRSCGEGF